MSDQTFELVWMQRLGGGCEVLRRSIPAADALKVLEQADREDYGPGGVVLLRPDGETEAGAALLARLDTAEAENAYLREWLRGACSIADADIDAALAKARAAPPGSSTTPEQAGAQAQNAMDMAERIRLRGFEG